MNCMRASNYFVKEPPLKEFYINSCGYFSEIDRKTGAKRPSGRPDWQIICVVGGEIWVEYDGVKAAVKSGQAVVFEPHEPQIYGSNCHGEGAYYWIHFSGDRAKEILDACSLKSGGVSDVNADKSDVDYILDMMTEINIKPPCYQIRLLSLFTRLLTELKRRADTYEADGFGFEKIRPAIAAMERDTAAMSSVDDYAKLCLMSKSYFIHKFKAVTGKSPMQYKNAIVMERAKSLLRNTSLSVGEIAESVGVSNSLYLSKKFGKAFGCSPTEYRNRHKYR